MWKFLRIFLPIRFYVKSDTVNSKDPNMAIMTISKVFNFDFDKFLQFSRAEIY